MGCVVVCCVLRVACLVLCLSLFVVARALSLMVLKISYNGVCMGGFVVHIPVASSPQSVFYERRFNRLYFDKDLV